MRQAADQLASHIGVKHACGALGVPRASLYRHRSRAKQTTPKSDRPISKRALNLQEGANIIEVLNSDRFVDESPRQIWAKLLDEGTYLCSWSSMYRILRAHDQVSERRNQLSHPTYQNRNYWQLPPISCGVGTLPS